MTNIIKSSLTISGDRVNFSMPISKIDIEKRMIHGWATTDALDKQGDVVDAEASVRAFSNFKNNLREMHQPIAVGKVVSFKQDKYYDQKTNKFYNGIVVSAYVSKGAQDTWEKVLDGTLTGFSIGGEIHEAEKVYDESLGKSYQVIKDYSLSELSLVDNPANQFANVFSIEKGEMHGYLIKAEIENVFWCRKDDIVQMSKESNSSCPQCDSQMSNIGFVESNDLDKASVVKSMVSESREIEILKGISEGSYVKFNGEYGKILRIIFKGGARFSSDEMAIIAKSDDPVVIIKQYSQIDGTIVPTDRRVIKYISSLENVNAINKSEVKEVSKMDSDIIVVDEIEKSVQVEPEPTALPVVEQDATVSTEKAIEVEIEEEDDAEEEMAEDMEEEVAQKASDVEVTKSDEAVSEAAQLVSKAVAEINETLASTLSTLAETVKALDAKIEGINKSVTGAIAEVESKVEGVKDSFGKRVDAVEKDTAFRKSADLGEILQEEPVIMEKSMWGGRFLTNADLF